MKAGNALIPISVANNRFESENFANALARLPYPIENALFVIMDELHAYNAARNLKSKELAFVLQRTYQKSTAYKDRRKWIEKLMRTGGFTIENYTVKRMSDFFDSAYVRAMRTVAILACTDSRFSEDIDQSVRKFLALRGLNADDDSYTRHFRLSRQYLMEEIAINIRIRVVEELEIEFYFGAHHRPLQKLYEGHYDVDPTAMIYEETRISKLYSFWEWSEGLGDWTSDLDASA